MIYSPLVASIHPSIWKRPSRKPTSSPDERPSYAVRRSYAPPCEASWTAVNGTTRSLDTPLRIRKGKLPRLPGVQSSDNSTPKSVSQCYEPSTKPEQPVAVVVE